jgi:hypothetical protein
LLRYVRDVVAWSTGRQLDRMQNNTIEIKRDIQFLAVLNCVQNPRVSQDESPHFGVKRLVTLLILQNMINPLKIDWLLNCCWPPSAQWFLVPSPTRPTTVFHCQTAQGVFRTCRFNCWLLDHTVNVVKGYSSCLLWEPSPGYRSRCSDWLRAGRRKGRSSSPGRDKNFIFSTSSRPALGPTQPPVQWILGALSAGAKLPRREADHSLPTSAEVKKIWIYTSTPPYSFMA